MTKYSITDLATNATVHGYSLEEAAQVMNISAEDFAFAIENDGEATTCEHRAVESEANALESHEAMQSPSEYAAFLVRWEGGDRAKALAAFIDAVQNDPTFRLAPKQWVKDTAVAIASHGE